MGRLHWTGQVTLLARSATRIVAPDVTYRSYNH